MVNHYDYINVFGGNGIFLGFGNKKSLEFKNRINGNYMRQKLTFSWICCRMYNVIMYCDNNDQIFIAKIYCNMLIDKYFIYQSKQNGIVDRKDRKLLNKFIEQTIKECGI